MRRRKNTAGPRLPLIVALNESSTGGLTFTVRLRGKGLQHNDARRDAPILDFCFRQAEYRRVAKPAMAKTPPPRWDLIAADIPRYCLVSVQTARGCSFDCGF